MFDDISSYRTAPTLQVRQDGILEGCGLSRHGLVMQVNYHGDTVIGRVSQLPISASPGDMVGLCDFLSEHLGDSIGHIEELEVDPRRF